MLSRRRFIFTGAAATVAAAGGLWMSIEQHNEPLSIEWALARLDVLESTKPVHQGKWNLYKTLIHCAQSVEYCMTGYPQHKSDLFKSTLGRTAFQTFKAKRKMSHNLAEAIPGAPAFSVSQDMNQAFGRFRQSMLNFRGYNDRLLPHFAYGELSKGEYEMAHVMHFNNHLSEFG